jgi:hypothetical protein
MRADDVEQSGPFEASLMSVVGTEFLTWLYFFGENQGFEVGNSVTLQLSTLPDYRASVRAGKLHHCKEVLEAIYSGARIQTLALEVDVKGAPYSFALSSDGFVGQLRERVSEDALDQSTAGPSEPEEKHEHEEEAMLMLRMSLLDEVEKLIAHAFGTFVQRRADQGLFAKDLSEIRSRVEEALQKQKRYVGERRPPLPDSSVHA